MDPHCLELAETKWLDYVKLSYILHMNYTNGTRGSNG